MQLYQETCLGKLVKLHQWDVSLGLSGHVALNSFVFKLGRWKLIIVAL